MGDVVYGTPFGQPKTETDKALSQCGDNLGLREGLRKSLEEAAMDADFKPVDQAELAAALAIFVG